MQEKGCLLVEVVGYEQTKKHRQERNLLRPNPGDVLREWFHQRTIPVPRTTDVGVAKTDGAGQVRPMTSAHASLQTLEGCVRSPAKRIEKNCRGVCKATLASHLKMSERLLEISARRTPLDLYEN